MSTQGLRDGDVYRYDPVQRHCHEGIFIVREIDGELFRYDTFWDTQPNRITDSDISGTPEFEFNLNDGWEPVDRHDHAVYHPDDIRTITSQHGLRRTHYRRIGATQDHREQARQIERQLADLDAERRHLSRREQYLMQQLREAHLGYQGGRR